MCSLGNFLSLSHCFCPAVLARALASEAFQPRIAGDPAVEEVGDSQRVARQGTDMKVTGLRPGLGKDRADPAAEGGTVLCPEEPPGRTGSEAGHERGVQGGGPPDGQSCQAGFQAKRSRKVWTAGGQTSSRARGKPRVGSRKVHF